MFKFDSSLFNSNIAIGSIKTVEPLLDISCTNPFMLARYSSFTGITKRPFLIVIIFSLIYFEYEDECIKLFSFKRMSCSNFLCFLLIV